MNHDDIYYDIVLVWTLGMFTMRGWLYIFTLGYMVRMHRGQRKINMRRLDFLGRTRQRSLTTQYRNWALNRLLHENYRTIIIIVLVLWLVDILGAVFVIIINYCQPVWPLIGCPLHNITVINVTWQILL